MSLRFILYFFLGGSIVSLVAYLSGTGRGLLAAFIATLPSTTILTFLLTYVEGGQQGLISYARGMMLFTPAWLAYVAVLLLTVKRLGIGWALALGLAAFLVLALLTRQVARPWTG